MNITELRTKLEEEFGYNVAIIEDKTYIFKSGGAVLMMLDEDNDIKVYDDNYIGFEIFLLLKEYAETDPYERLQETKDDFKLNEEMEEIGNIQSILLKTLNDMFPSDKNKEDR